jgi:hypothetical protein
MSNAQIAATARRREIAVGELVEVKFAGRVVARSEIDGALIVMGADGRTLACDRNSIVDEAAQ